MESNAINYWQNGASCPFLAIRELRAAMMCWVGTVRRVVFPRCLNCINFAHRPRDFGVDHATNKVSSICVLSSTGTSLGRRASWVAVVHGNYHFSDGQSKAPVVISHLGPDYGIPRLIDDRTKLH